MTNPFEKYERIHGKLKISIDEVEYELDATVNDKVEFIKIKQKMDKGQALTEDMFEYAKKLLAKSYPDKDPQVFDTLLTVDSSKFFDELSIAFGFITRKQLDKLYAKHYGEKGEKKKNDEGGI